MKRIVFISLALIWASISFAQDSKVTSGIMNIQTANELPGAAQKAELFKKGVGKILTGMENGPINPKKLPKAYASLATGYFALLNDSIYLSENPDLHFKCLEAVKKAKELDVKGRYTKGPFVFIETNLPFSVFNYGTSFYNTGDYGKALPYMKVASELAPDNMSFNMLHGYALLNTNDTAAAIPALQKTIDLWNSTEETERDSGMKKNVLTTNIILATVHNTFSKDPGKALEVLAKARKEYPTNANLRKTELGIYQQNPQLFEEARAKFDAAMKADPSDNIVKLAYASLLTQNGDKDKGIDLYNEVLKTDPNNYQANVNVGAFYINEAVAAKGEYDDTPSSEESKLETLEEKIYDNLRKAYPFMVKSHEAQPENAEWLQQLVSISTTIEELLPDARK
ncbi:MAG: tetratricopeptide repeat protein, partial [Bacteroidia bacterium]